MSKHKRPEEGALASYDPEEAVSLGDLMSRAEAGVRKSGNGGVAIDFNGTDWVVAIEYGVEMEPTDDDPGSSMTGAAAYGVESTLYWALYNAISEANW